MNGSQVPLHDFRIAHLRALSHWSIHMNKRPLSEAAAGAMNVRVWVIGAAKPPGRRRPKSRR